MAEKTTKRIFELSDRKMMRVLVAIIAVLVFLGGYYNIQMRNAQRNYNALYQKYKKLQKTATSVSQ